MARGSDPPYGPSRNSHRNCFEQFPTTVKYIVTEKCLASFPYLVIHKLQNNFYQFACYICHHAFLDVRSQDLDVSWVGECGCVWVCVGGRDVVRCSSRGR